MATHLPTPYETTTQDTLLVDLDDARIVTVQFAQDAAAGAAADGVLEVGRVVAVDIGGTELGEDYTGANVAYGLINECIDISAGNVLAAVVIKGHVCASKIGANIDLAAKQALSFEEKQGAQDITYVGGHSGATTSTS